MLLRVWMAGCGKVAGLAVGLAGIVGCGEIVSVVYPVYPVYPATPAYAASFATGAASCVAGVGTPRALSIPSSNAPPLGCVAAGQSAMGYFAFHPAAKAQEYAYGQTVLPAVWAGSDLTLTFYGEETLGNATWQVDTACNSGSGASFAWNYGPVVTVSTAVSSMAGPDGMINTSLFSGIASANSNGCAPGSVLQYRITRWAHDTAAGEIYLVGTTLIAR